LAVLLQAQNTDGSGTTNLTATGTDSLVTKIKHATKQLQIYAGRVGLSGVDGGVGKYDMSTGQVITAEIWTAFLHETASPSAIRGSTSVTFTASLDDGSTVVVNRWWWVADAGSSWNWGGTCYQTNPCHATIGGSGTMSVEASVDGGAVQASAHVLSYTSFTLDADKNAANSGDTVTFTPMFDGSAGTAARWRWVPADTSTGDSSACDAGVSPCKKQMVASGTMWAYTNATAGQGDSASQTVTVTPVIAVSCSPRILTRGQSTTCTASTLAVGTFTPTSWVFTPAADPQFYNTTSVTRSTGVGNAQWAGVMAVSGVVTVGGTVGTTTAQSGADTITVQDRNWTWAGETSATSEPPGSYECATYTHYQALQDSLAMGWAGGTECGNQTYPFTPFYSNGNGGITVAPITDGPNTGLSYVTDISIHLDMHAQVLKDLRPDGNAYAFTLASDPTTTAACAAVSVSSPTTLTTTNVTCQGNSDYSTFYNGSWRHEDCHMTVAIGVWASVPDAKALGERVVSPDTDYTRSQVLYQGNGYSQAGFSIDSASKLLDYLPATAYHAWWYSPTDSSWVYTPLNARQGLVSGC
jgi:hypothetical protein